MFQLLLLLYQSHQTVFPSFGKWNQTIKFVTHHQHHRNSKDSNIEENYSGKQYKNVTKNNFSVRMWDYATESVKISSNLINQTESSQRHHKLQNHQKSFIESLSKSWQSRIFGKNLCEGKNLQTDAFVDVKQLPW